MSVLFIFSLDFSAPVVARKHFLAYCVYRGRRMLESRLFLCVAYCVFLQFRFAK